MAALVESLLQFTLLLLINTPCYSAPYSYFANYQGNGVQALYSSSTTLKFRSEFSFYGERFNSIKVQKNGNIILENTIKGNTANLDVFQTSQMPTRGVVYYKVLSTNVAEELQQTLGVIEGKFEDLSNSNPLWASIITWHELTTGDGKSNTFQMVMMSMNNTGASFIIYNYGSIQWPNSKAEGSCKAGYSTSYGKHRYVIPGSQVGDIVSIMNVTNVGEPGMWAFQVNKPDTSLVSEASEFYLAFGPTLRSPASNLYVLVSTREENDVPFTVECPTLRLRLSGTTRKGVHSRINLPSSVKVSSSDSTKGIRVYTTNSQKISVVGVVETGEKMAQFSVLHQRHVSQEYVFHVGIADDYEPVFTYAIIVAMSDDTTIRVRAPLPLIAGRIRLGANAEADINMNNYGTVLVYSRRDLTGMKITSYSKPIVVFSGHICTQIPPRYPDCDAIIEQLPSTHDWGTQFIIPPMYNRTYSQLQVMSSSANTQFTLDCVTNTGRYLGGKTHSISTEGGSLLLNQQENEICFMDANNPVMAIQYGISKGADISNRPGGPAMVLIPSIKQYSFNSLVPASQISFKYHIMLIVPAEYHHPSLIHLNGSLKLDQQKYTTMVYYNNYTITHYVYIIKLKAGNYDIHSLQPQARMGVLVYGYSDSTSLAYLPSITSSGTQFDKSLVKVMVGQNHGVCKNTTVERSFTFWRNESGSVISWENLLRTNSSDGKTFWCEVPTYGDEPEYFYRKRFTPSSLSINIGGGGTKCSFTVKVFPKEVTTIVHTNVTLYCMTSGDEDISSMKWHHNDSIEVGSGPILYITGVDSTDNGTYTCSVTKDNEETSSDTSSLVVLSNPPVILEHPVSVHIVLNETNNPIRLTCRADNANGELWWEKDERYPSDTENRNWAIVDSDGVRAVIDYRGDLILIITDENTDGVYRCVAFNGSGHAVSSVAEVVIQGTQPPTIIMHPANQSILVNSTFTLQCLAVGYGNISYLWMKYNTTMNVSTTHQRFGELVIEDSNRGSEGEYTCVAYVGEEFAYSSPAFVTVLEPGEDIADRDLAVFVHPLYLLVEEGMNATFYCYGTYGRGNYTYMWLDGMGKTVGNESILVLSSVSEVQSGNYTCVVFDERGMKVEESAELTVENATVPNITFPKMKDIQITIADRLRNAVFSCETGLQGISYIWEKENGSLPNRAYGVNSSTLVIPNLAVADAGRYRCVIKQDNIDRNRTSPYVHLNITVSPPTIKFHPDNITTAFGGNFSITCIADGYGPLTYTWEKKGIGVLQKSSSPRLALSNVTESMEGLYRCRVVNEHQGRVLSEYARVKVRVSQRVEFQDCNNKSLHSHLIIDNLREPSFLNGNNLFLQGPIFSSSKQLSKDVKLLADSMVYICHEGVSDDGMGRKQQNVQLAVGIAIEPQWVLSLATNCREGCKNEQFNVIPFNLVGGVTNASKLCNGKVNEKPIKVKRGADIYKSPQNSSLLLLKLDKSLLKSYITKETLLLRNQLIKLKAGNAVDLLGIPSDAATLDTPVKYRFRIRSKLPPPNAPLPTAMVTDRCSEDLPPPCTWIPGSPILYQPPRSTKYAMLGLAATKEDCSEAEVYESHISLSKDIEWIDETVI